MGLYLDNGYINMDEIITGAKTPFIFMTGGRGTGKTYGALRCSIINKMRMLYLRRTQVQTDLIKRAEMSPFKAVNDKEGFCVYPFKLTKYNSLIAEGFYDDDGKLKRKNDDIIGYTAALSTFASLRGVDFSDVDIIIYDEFIPESTAGTIKGEYEALMNLYETVNRNRELEGKNPTILLCMSNSTKAANPIYMGAKLTTRVYRMREKGVPDYVDTVRGVTLYAFPETDIGTKKRGTALYKFAGKNYVEHAIENRFTHDNPTNTVSRNLKEYKALFQIGELTVYKHKSLSRLYVTTHRSGSCEKFEPVGNDVLVFKTKYARMIYVYMSSDLIDYEKYEYEILLKEYVSFTYKG